MNWQEVLLALAPYLLPPLIGVVAVLVKSAFEKMPSSKQAIAQQVVSAVVIGLEQNPGILPFNGPAKKQMAIERTGAVMANYGLKVPPQLIDSMIETTVFAINSAKAPVPVTEISAG